MTILKGRLAFVLISKIYRQMYANTGIATDSARISSVGTLGPLAVQALPPLIRRAADAPTPGTRITPPGQNSVCQPAVVP